MKNVQEYDFWSKIDQIMIMSNMPKKHPVLLHIFTGLKHTFKGLSTLSQV
jgi:hypothetical protein